MFLMMKYPGARFLSWESHADILSTRLPKTGPKCAPVRGSGNWCIITSFHLLSPILKILFMGNAKKYFKGPITMGKDGMLFFLPPIPVRSTSKTF